jgi:dolichol-phosphate mannosyltransferase
MEGPGVASSSGSQPQLSIVLASLNEHETLPQLIDRIVRLELPPHELIVADDGSTDGTREYLLEIAKRDRRIRLLFHEGKQTTLRAQCQAIEASLGKYIVVMDADLQHPPETIPAILRELEAGSGLVVASRYAPGGSPGPRSFARLAISRGAEWMAKSLLAPARRVRDPVSGFFGFRRTIWVPLNREYRGYKLLLFLLAMAEGSPISEVPFRFEPRVGGSSKVTQGPAFIRHFLIEVLLARRLASTLDRS